MPSSPCSMPPQLSWRLLSACQQPVSPKEEPVTALSRYPRRVRGAKRVVSRHRFPLQIPSRSTPTRGEALLFVSHPFFHVLDHKECLTGPGQAGPNQGSSHGGPSLKLVDLAARCK